MAAAITRAFAREANQLISSKFQPPNPTRSDLVEGVTSSNYYRHPPSIRGRVRDNHQFAKKFFGAEATGNLRSHRFAAISPARALGATG